MDPFGQGFQVPIHFVNECDPPSIGKISQLPLS